MSLKLYAPLGNPRGSKVLIASELANVEVQLIDLTYEQMKKEDHKQRHPLGKIPVLETAEGYLFESNAILRYIARLNPQSGLYGENLHQQGQVDQWLDFGSSEIEPILISLMIPVLGYYPLDAQAGHRAHQDLMVRFHVLDHHLKANNFFVGTRLTIADIELASCVLSAYRFIIDETIRKNLPNLSRWFEYVSQIPQFLEYFGRPRNCKVPFPALQITHVQQQQPQTEQKKQQSKQQQQTHQPEQKAVKQQQQQQPKEEKKKQDKVQVEKVKQQQPQKAPEEAQVEEEEQPKKKEANPLDLLPPSTFNIDDWKRQFLAAKDENQMKQQFDWFWQNFDEQGWSIWEILYQKTDTEGTMLLKTNNTMKGFIQRTEPNLRKYSFAIHGVYGEEPNLEIRGAWLWRGTDIPQELREHPSYEFHIFNKLQKSNEADKKLFEEYWLNQTEDDSYVKGLRLRTSVYFR